MLWLKILIGLENSVLLKSKVAVITGAASLRGIGKATARAFAAQGASIVILDH